MTCSHSFALTFQSNAPGCYGILVSMMMPSGIGLEELLVKAGADGRCPAQCPYLELFSLCGTFPEGADAPGGARASSGAAMEGGAAAGRSPASRVAGLRKTTKSGRGPSGARAVAARRSPDDHQTIRRSPGDHQTITRRSPDAHQTITRRTPTAWKCCRPRGSVAGRVD